MVKVTAGNTCAIACGTHNSQLQVFKSWDVRFWQYNALWKQYIRDVRPTDASHDYELQL